MKAIKQKIIKLEKEKNIKVKKRDKLNDEISCINSQLKELKNIEKQYEKLELEGKKLLEIINQSESTFHTKKLVDLINSEE